MKNGTESMGNGAATDDRFTGQIGYRGNARRDMAGISGEQANPPTPAIGSVMDTPLPSQPTMSLGELDSLAEPVYAAQGWLDSATGALADHPLLRGLLLELPPKGTVPTGAWLDRWFEAARSILELLYVQGGPATTQRRA